MSNSFRIAIVGCGRIAARHLAAALAVEGVEVSALVDPVANHAQQLAERFHLSTRIVPSVSEVLGDIDGAIIATPNHLHRQPAVECLMAGVSTLIEKPLTTTVEDGGLICQVAQEHSAIAAVAYVTRFREQVQTMHALLKSRYFGRIRRFAYQAGTRGGWTPLSNYNLDRGSTGGGVLVVTGTHFLDRMLYWFGYPVQATLLQDGLGGPEANAFASFKYETEDGELIGTARFSKSVQLPTGFSMETDAGIVLLGEGPDDPIRLLPADRPDLETTIGRRTTGCGSGGVAATNLFELQLQSFVEAAQGHGEPMVSAEQGLESLRLLDELYKNASPIESPEQNSASSDRQETPVS